METKTLLQKAEARFLENKFDEALSLFEYMKKGERNSVSAIRLKARIHFAKGDFEKCVAAYMKSKIALEMTAKDYLRLAKSKKHLDEVLQSGKILRDAIYKYPDNDDLAYEYVLYLLEVSSLGNALRFMKKRIEKSPENLKLLYHCADMLFQSGDFDQSVELVNRCIELDKRVCKARLLLIHLYHNEYGYSRKGIADPRYRHIFEEYDTERIFCEEKSPENPGFLLFLTNIGSPISTWTTEGLRKAAFIALENDYLESARAFIAEIRMRPGALDSLLNELSKRQMRTAVCNCNSIDLSLQMENGYHLSCKNDEAEESFDQCKYNLSHIMLHNVDDIGKDVHGIFRINENEIKKLFRHLGDMSYFSSCGYRYYLVHHKNAGIEGGSRGTLRTLDYITIIATDDLKHIITCYPSDADMTRFISRSNRLVS